MLAQRIKTARQNKRLTQAELAKKLGVAQSTVGGWEAGAREPSLDMIRKIADVLDVSNSYLIGGYIPSSNKELFKALKSSRLAAGLSKEELAKKIEESEEFVSAYEEGNEGFTTMQLEKISKAFNIPISVLSPDGWEIRTRPLDITSKQWDDLPDDSKRFLFKKYFRSLSREEQVSFILEIQDENE